MASTPLRAARCAAFTKASTVACNSAVVIAWGGASWGKCGVAEGPSVCQPPASGCRSCPPCQGTALDALRPAWANWIHTAVWGARARARCRWLVSAASVRSSHRPRQRGVMRPSGSTAVASMVNMPAPLLSRLPQCIRCQSLAQPSMAWYWHMGATTRRLGSVRPPSGADKAKGVNNRLMVCDGFGVGVVSGRRSIAQA